MPTQKLTNEIAAAAIAGFEAQKRKIDEQIRELRGMIGGVNAKKVTAPVASAKRKRRMTAAGRRAIAEATRKRWAAFHMKGAGTARNKSAAKATSTKKISNKTGAKRMP